MTDFKEIMQNQVNMPEDEQRKAGQAIGGDMNPQHAAFLQELIGMLDRKEIVASDAQSMLNHEVYDALDEQWKDKVDLALVNVADQVRLIEDFYRSTETPNSSPQLQTMIDHLWQMKQRIEATHDVFKF